MTLASNVVRQEEVATGAPDFSGHTPVSDTTDRAEMDALVSRLHGNRHQWQQLTIPDRIELIRAIRDDLYNQRQHWITAEMAGKKIAPGSLGEAEEWILLATVFRALDQIERSLVDIEQRGRPQIAGPITRRHDGRLVARVFPQTWYDRILFTGVTGEVWMPKGLTEQALKSSQASQYHTTSGKGRVTLILGAGNTTMLVATDMLYKLFVELAVVVVKLNPVNAYMAGILGEAFSVLIKDGYAAIVCGGVEEGQYLCHHHHVTDLHLTGSDKTYEAIVFGSGVEGRARRRARAPLLTKPFTGELGNVSPVIVVPGPWREGDLVAQACQFSTWLAANAGFGCLTPRVLIQHSSWPQRRAFLAKIGDTLAGVQPRAAYYPGAHHRHRTYLQAHPQSQCYGFPDGDELPWTIVPDLDPREGQDICFRSEAFCGLCAETGLDAVDPVDFLQQAVAFANETLWGSLNATLLVHPESLRDQSIAAAVERAISDLRYGTVSLNILAFYAAFLMVMPWGAYPGHDIYDIQSGRGKVFNFLMLPGAEKSVLRAPFRRLDPMTVTSRVALRFGRRMCTFSAYPSFRKMPALMAYALIS